MRRFDTSGTKGAFEVKGVAGALMAAAKCGHLARSRPVFGAICAHLVVSGVKAPAAPASRPYDSELLHVGPVGPGLHLHLDPGLELVSARHQTRHLLCELV